MFNLVGKTGSGLKFPTESNLELVDFFLMVYKYLLRQVRC